ncbi:DUF4136 domain-containing protein [Agriterribacter sp.]|uniref:DUF4136 domain-containing protein n=1 Tax=Agriterribacter sp. TaxID=2821509 RepID=UPI002C33A268|nr:DUF4136 domain-containing protein [Agriterribacter sp.]HRO46071.1 DUF4136 domain-containing protein [Agriterribacter sp.]HRQ16131.1 DUF4136 domain-containing protein [Agriterribacter sp.]
MKQHKIYLALTGSLLGIVLLGSCAKDPLKNMTNEESRIYITNYDSSAHFGSFQTYSITDSVAVISNGALQKRTLTATDAAFIQAVKDNMAERGYQLVANNEHPDLGINISSVFNNQTGVISYPSYWGYYGSYWDPYYWGFGGYDYYFPYVSYAVYQIREGALSIDMVDLKDAGNDKKIEGVWNGLIRGEAIFNASTAASQVKALFDQSPYISSNH